MKKETVSSFNNDVLLKSVITIMASPLFLSAQAKATIRCDESNNNNNNTRLGFEIFKHHFSVSAFNFNVSLALTLPGLVSSEFLLSPRKANAKVRQRDVIDSIAGPIKTNESNSSYSFMIQPSIRDTFDEIVRKRE